MKLQSFVVGTVPKKCIVHAAFHSFTTVVQQWSVSHRTDPEHGKTSLLLTYNLNYWAAGGWGCQNYTFASPPLGQRSSFRIYTCWALKWSFCLIQQHIIALHTHGLKGIGALSFTYFLLSIDFIVLGKKGETPQEVCRYNIVRKRSECKSSFDELVKGGWGLKWEMCEVGPLC